MEFSQSEDGIYYLHPYYPTRYKEHEGVSESIIAYKQCYQRPIDRFTNEIEEALINQMNGDANKLTKYCVVVVPSHSKERWSEPLLRTANKMCSDLSMKNCSKALIRVEEHEKLSTGGERSIESHMRTIDVDEHTDLQGKKVVLIDDVTTTGNSILACARKLKEVGASSVAAIAIGKTTIPEL